MRRSSGIALSVVLALTLTGCGSGYATTREQIKEQAAFVKECREAGGVPSYNGVPQQICVFEGRDDE